MWCGKCCDVDVVWNSCGCGMVRDVDCGCVVWCEMVVGGRLWRTVMSDVEYGGPR